jgi:hypothetical protein
MTMSSLLHTPSPSTQFLQHMELYFCFILKMNDHLLEHGVLNMGQHSSNIVPRDWEKEME